MAHTPALTDLQLILLSTAAARADANVFPLKNCIADRTGEVTGSVAPLIDRGLLAEQPETVRVRVWREDGDQRIGLAVTDAGRALIDGGPVEGNSDEAAAAPLVEASPLRAGSKSGAVLALLARADGATLAELIAVTGWLPHTTRAALTGLRKNPRIRDTRCRRISPANIGPNLFHHIRTVSWQMSIPRSNSRSSTFRSDSGNRTYIITTNRITSGDELK